MGLFVLKVPLNPNQPTNQPTFSITELCGLFSSSTVA